MREPPIAGSGVRRLPVKQLLQRIRKGEADIKAGRCIPHAQVFSQLRKRLNDRIRDQEREASIKQPPASGPDSASAPAS